MYKEMNDSQLIGGFSSNPSPTGLTPVSLGWLNGFLSNASKSSFWVSSPSFSCFLRRKHPHYEKIKMSTMIADTWTHKVEHNSKSNNQQRSDYNWNDDSIYRDLSTCCGRLLEPDSSLQEKHFHIIFVKCIQLTKLGSFIPFTEIKLSWTSILAEVIRMNRLSIFCFF